MNKQNILIVEDEKKVSDLMEKVCCTHNVTLVNSAIKAIELLKNKPSIFILLIIPYRF